MLLDPMDSREYDRESAVNAVRNGSIAWPARIRQRVGHGFRVMRRHLKSGSAGFTLVEVLVVAIIISILAAVAVPLYTGYIKDQKRKAAVTVAQTVAVTASSFKRRTGAAPTLDQLKTAIVIPNPDQFELSLTVDNGKNFVHVVDKSDPECWGEAGF
jgi:prepilin-type N-terminal cleavage/methylation domain-containing protein